MIRTIANLRDAVSFDRFVLADVIPLVDEKSTHSDVDLREGTTKITITVMDEIGLGSRDRLAQHLRPLLFGSAWKILDTVVELGLNQALQRSRWRIEEKCKLAHCAASPPFDAQAALWGKIARVYAGTADARHCLVHRGFTMTPSGDMTNIKDPVSGRGYPDVTASEQTAFCRLAQRVLRAVETASVSGRDRLDIVFSLDQLASHHGQAELNHGVLVDKPATRIIVNAFKRGSEWVVDTQKAKAEAEFRCPGSKHWDVEIWFPESAFPPMLGRLEEAPHGTAVPVDPAAPPEWSL